MIRELQLRILPEQAASEQSIAAYVAREQSMDIRSIKSVRVLKRSIDARQRTVMVNLKVRVYIDEFPQDDEFPRIEYGDVSGKPRAIVVGAGPAGLFAALRLIELGICPVVVERGKNVHDRRKDIALISREQRVDPESNYSFGEGGAGAFSDGKLYTRSKKRGSVERILQIFCQHGASVSILSDAHPHIGTDKLPRVIERMRNRIIESGGEVHFETRMERLIIDGDEVCGIVTADGREFTGPVILATGHSARDVYYMLHENGVELESKGIAVGVRLEHPQQLIDSIQYHNPEGRGKYLPAAEYSFVTQVKGRGVYSFCMCPGGFVVPAASGPEQIVVNGMSPSNSMGQFGYGCGVAAGGFRSPVFYVWSFGGDKISGGSRTAVLFERELQTDGSCPTHDRFCQSSQFVRFASLLLFTGTHRFAVAFLVTRFYRRPVAGRIQIFWESISWIPHPGSRDDRGGNSHLFSCTNTT